MRIVVFGLSITSSWGNGHATLWRGLVAALAKLGHEVVFFERDQPWYAENRDAAVVPGCELVLYRDWREIRMRAGHMLRDADAAIVTSFCPDGVAALALLRRESRPLRVFYDLDTPVTLAMIARGDALEAIGPDGLRDYELVLSFTGGPALDRLREDLGAGAVVPLYGHADPAVHRPAAPQPAFTADLSYIGTYAADRQSGVEALFVEPARRAPWRRFVLAGAQYPPDFPWTQNIHFVRHLPPGDHPAFYASSALTLNVTREAMATAGWCPSGRLFEAAACGAAIVTDAWPGLESFFEPDREIIVARDTADVLAALTEPAEALAAIGQAARRRLLDEHTAAHRARELAGVLETAIAGRVAAPAAWES
jgi:spore maturation protein CgeB